MPQENDTDVTTAETLPSEVLSSTDVAVSAVPDSEPTSDTQIQNSHTLPPATFEQALAFQQQKDWGKSLEAYQQLLDQSRTQDRSTLSDTQASVIYHNMSAIAFEQNDLLKAYVWSKKAVTLNPSNSLAKTAFEHYATQFQVPHIAKNASGFENFKKTAGLVPVDLWFVLSSLFVLLSFFLFFKKQLADRRSVLEGLYTRAAKWPIIMSIAAAVIFSSITWLTYADSKIPRAIVMTDSAPVQTAAGDNKPVIFAAPAGFEVEVLQKQDGYYQVRSAGAFSGWMRQSDLELLSLIF
ncbi:IdeS/Mac family cysteine endopeptidase [Pseudobdellovibrio exovorus]|uniref:TPR domain-containing protein n=1 Tax=Pseudobdellovibrio exovorus JSS TaxID=1184267 RepID=M4VBJ2_9BACT|nr:IdeS/Mac family cysteine endopeptidase [Pseudobdellovibrio exovorus]AGH96578.1 TPR domain-containing protein [Pseudobdellovibrio exovorus JSS]